MSWEVLDNSKNPAVAFGSELTLSNRGSVELGSTGWTLYFNFVREIVPESLPAGVEVTHLNGDFFKLAPTGAFAPLEPGGSVVGGQLMANVAFPGLTLRYTTDGSEPDERSPAYTGPVAVSGVVKLKTFDTRGRKSRTSVLDPAAPGG